MAAVAARLSRATAPRLVAQAAARPALRQLATESAPASTAAAVAAARAKPKGDGLPSLQEAASQLSYARGLFFGHVNVPRFLPYPGKPSGTRARRR